MKTHFHHSTDARGDGTTRPSLRPAVNLQGVTKVYDMGVEPIPPGNLSPLEETDVHDDVRSLDVYKDQVGAFLEDGTVIQVCDGACDPD